MGFTRLAGACQAWISVGGREGWRESERESGVEVVEMEKCGAQKASAQKSRPDFWNTPKQPASAHSTNPRPLLAEVYCSN